MSYGLGLNYFALEGGVSGRSSLKIQGKGNTKMTLLSAYITLKMPLLTPDPQVKTNTQAFFALPACISSPLSLYLDPLPVALGFLQQPSPLVPSGLVLDDALSS